MNKKVREEMEKIKLSKEMDKRREKSIFKAKSEILGVRKRSLNLLPLLATAVCIAILIPLGLSLHSNDHSLGSPVKTKLNKENNSQNQTISSIKKNNDTPSSSQTPDKNNQSTNSAQTDDFKGVDRVQIHMMNKQVGWGILSSISSGNQFQDKVVRTVNGGKTWGDVSPKGPHQDIIGFNTLNESSMWVLQSVSDPNATQVLTLYRTHDGGKTWDTTQIRQHVTTAPIRSAQIDEISSKDALINLIPDHGMNSMPGILIKSQDNGKTWTPVPNHSKDIPLGGFIHFVSKKKGWLSVSPCSTCQSSLYLSQDGGQSWSNVPLTAPHSFAGDHVSPTDGTQGSQSVPLFSANHPEQGILPVNFAKNPSIEGNGVYSTQDGGRTWNFVGPLPKSVGFHSYVNVHILVYLSNGPNYKLYVSRNGGETWTTNQLSTQSFVKEFESYNPSQIDFLTSQVGWMVLVAKQQGGGTPHIWETDDGGKTWTKIKWYYIGKG